VGAVADAVEDVTRLGRRELERVAAAAANHAGPDGRAGPELAADLQALSPRVTPAALPLLQDLCARLGVATDRPIELPLDDTPYWLRGAHPLAGRRSRARLDGVVDVLVVGAGLTGASAAYHLAGRGLRVAVLDAGDPAMEASGRNGGHFELVPENSIGRYEGLARERLKFVRRTRPHVSPDDALAEAERQAAAVLRLTLRNRQRLRELVELEEIECDFCPAGWLFLADDAEVERGIVEEAPLVEAHGARVELWPPARVQRELGFTTRFRSRFLPDDGSYHPFRYACGLLDRALARGVELYARLRVLGIESQASDRHEATTAEGRVVARRVIVATNAFTPELLPELVIGPYQSQVMLTEHVQDRARGRIVTSERGPVYFNQPRAGVRGDRAPLLFGGGDDRPLANPRSRRRSGRIHRLLLELRDELYPELCGQPPSAEWIGPMAFTPDQLPAIGELRPGLVVAAGFSGYGGSYTTAAGEAAARLALSGEAPSWLDAGVFAPARLVSRR
jgi:glycine/D-amino acid oxidase-like deaminating enzyme